MKREYIKSGPRRGGVKPIPVTPKPKIKPKGQRLRQKNEISTCCKSCRS